MNVIIKTQKMHCDGKMCICAIILQEHKQTFQFHFCKTLYVLLFKSCFFLFVVALAPAASQANGALHERGPLEDSGSSDAESDSSDDTDSDRDVGAALAHEEPHGDDALGHESETEIVELVVAPPVEPLPDEPAAAAAPALPDPVAVAAPAWAPGVDRAEINTSAKTKCVLCNLPIPRNEVRFRYYQFKSQFRFIHPLCFNDIPLPHRDHSIAMLQYQLNFLAGPLSADVDAAIEAALDL